VVVSRSEYKCNSKVQNQGEQRELHCAGDVCNKEVYIVLKVKSTNRFLVTCMGQDF
jgi:hypothetical protein